MSARRRSAGNEYYYIDQSQPVNIWRLILDFILIAITLGLAAALVMAYLSTGISPMKNWVFAFFGLGAPFLFLGNFVMLLLWTIRWRFWAFVPLVTLLFGLGHLGALVQVDFRKEYHAEEQTAGVFGKAGELAVMTYNVHGFSRNQPDHAGYLRTVDSIGAYALRMRPDVICFQEYETMNSADVRHMDQLFKDWPYRAFSFAGGNPATKIGYGQAIFSRLPLVNPRRIIFEGSSNSVLSADVLMGGDTVRLFSNHLQSTQIDNLSQERVERLDIAGAEGTTRFVRGVASRLKLNYRRRAIQVDTVARMIAATRYPVVVVGDFNDTPVSYTYKKMRGKLRDSFIDAGSGFAYTYNRLFSMLRIDYVFYSDSFEGMTYRSDNLPWSDHNPVVVRMRRLEP